MSFNVILAVDLNNGISKDGIIPWNHSDDLKHFKLKTKNGTVIMGKNTWNSLPIKPLPNRQNIVVSNTIDNLGYKNTIVVKTLDEALEKSISDKNNIWIIGGKKLYIDALTRNDVGVVELTRILKDYKTDNIINEKYFSNYHTINRKFIKDSDITLLFETLKQSKNEQEEQYLNLLKKLMNEKERETRNGITVSSFGERLEFDLSKGFPILTSKRVFWKGIVEELLFFIRGKTDSKLLLDKGVKIWEPNTTREFLDNRGLKDYNEGDMGPMYGFNWRHFGAEYTGKESNYTNKGFDQLKWCINEIMTNPTSRRIMMTAYNPQTTSQAVLPPCHSLLVQFYIKDGVLSEHMYQRSSDTFLGLPFNITQHSLLLHLVAHITGLKVGKLIISLGDCHIYKEHFEAVKKQLKNSTYSFPKLNIKKKINKESSIEEKIKFLEELEYLDFELKNYYCCPTIKAKMLA